MQVVEVAGSEVEKTGRIPGCVVVPIVVRVEADLGRRGEAGDEVTQLVRVGAAVGQAGQGRPGGGADILPPSQADLLQGEPGEYVTRLLYYNS